MKEKSHYPEDEYVRIIYSMNTVTKFRYLPIFRDVPTEQLEQLGTMLELKEICSGETIFNQGDTAKYLYILLTGKVSIRYKPYDGPPLTISSIIPGWVFGWSAALGRDTYTSGAYALLPSSTFVLSKENLLEICNWNNEAGIIFLDRLTSIIAERLNQTPQQILSVLAKSVDHSEGMDS